MLLIIIDLDPDLNFLRNILIFAGKHGLCKKKHYCVNFLQKAKNSLASCPRGKPQTKFYSGPGSFPAPVTSRITNFSPVRPEGASDFTSRRLRMDLAQLLKGRSKNVQKCEAIYLQGLIYALVPCTHIFSVNVPLKRH
jgi:hypothetical protein